MRKNGRHSIPGERTRSRPLRPNGFRPLSVVPPLRDEPTGGPDVAGSTDTPAVDVGRAGSATWPPGGAGAASTTGSSPADGTPEPEPDLRAGYAELRAWERAERLAGRDVAGGDGPPSVPAPRSGGFAGPPVNEQSANLRAMLRSMAERGLGELVARWGGVEALDHLDVEPLPDEPFDWTTVPPEHRGRVEQILVMVDDTCDTWFDREHRTACRRLLARVAAEPWVIARRGKAETIAGAIVWTIASFNGTVGRRRRGVRPATWIAGHLGLASPSAFPTRSIDIRIAAGIRLHRDGPEPVGEPGLIVSWRRRHAATVRDRLRADLA
jgi:hypothetical protein